MMKRTASLVLAFTALGPMPALAQERTWDWPGGMHPTSMMWGAWGFGMVLMMLVFWGLVIAAIVLGVRMLARLGKNEPGDRALEILRERYARGDIDKQEFESRKRDLGV